MVKIFRMSLIILLLTTSSTMGMGNKINMPSASDAQIAHEVGTAIQSVEIPMVDFVYVEPKPNGMIVLIGTLRTEDDIRKINSIAKNVNGVTEVSSTLKVGDHKFMYEKKIREYIDSGYERYKTFSTNNKQNIIKHLNEYLYYRNDLNINIIGKVEILRDLLIKDIKTIR